MNDRIFIHKVFSSEGDVESFDWSPVRLAPEDVEYLIAGHTLARIHRLMTSAWNMKTIHLALHPEHKRSIWNTELELAMRFVDTLFPPEEERQWQK